jgi:hypothetical protein
MINKIIIRWYLPARQSCLLNFAYSFYLKLAEVWTLRTFRLIGRTHFVNGLPHPRRLALQYRYFRFNQLILTVKQS